MQSFFLISKLQHLLISPAISSDIVRGPGSTPPPPFKQLY